MHGTQDAETLTLFSSLYLQACEAAYEGGVLLPALVGEVPDAGFLWG